MMAYVNTLFEAFGFRRAILLIMALGLLLSVGPDNATLAQTDAADAIVNWKTLDVTQTSDITETEPSIAVNPGSPNTFLMGMNTSEGKMAAYLSVDGGENWEGGFLPHFSSDNGIGQGDPVVGFDTDGRAYIVGISLNDFDCETKPNVIPPPGGVFVMRGSVDGTSVSWMEPVFVHLHQADQWSLDKPWMAIDTSNSSPFKNRIYVAWTNFFADGKTSIQFAFSTDGGETFPASSTELIALAESDSSINSDRGVQAANIAVGPEGDVYVVWVEGPSSEHPEVVERTLYMRHSSDGGENFGPPTKIADVANPGILDTGAYACDEPGRVLNGRIRIGTFPSVAADPTNPNRVYVVWNGANVSGGGDSEIYLSFSNDKGSNWSTTTDDPITVNNDSTNDQFLPSVAVDGLGTVFIEWYDRKDDPENLRFVPTGAFSSFAGLIFEQEALLEGEGFSGDFSVVYDYLQIAALPEGAVGAWVGDGDAHISIAEFVPKLDLIFVIDTTGSMFDDIDAVKTSATDIVNFIADSEVDFRIGLVTYRDHPISPYGSPGDYPSRIDLNFTTDEAAVINAINSLIVGGGADFRESVYSGLTTAIGFPWRDGVKKAVILMGDAPPHDPEPFTGFTLDSVCQLTG